jgi:hypothetical protein
MRFTVAATLLAGSVGLRAEKPAMPTVEVVLKVWGDRQAKVKSLRFDLSTERTISKGHLSLLLRSRTGQSTEPNPPTDVDIGGSETISLVGQKTRQSVVSQRWDPTDKGLYAETLLAVYDGRLYKTLRDPASNQYRYPTAIVRKLDKSPMAQSFPIVPLFFAVRGDDPKYFQGLKDYRVVAKDVAVGGRPCLHLKKEANQGRSESFYLDQERGYLVVRKTIEQNGMVTWEINVDNAVDPTVGWLPRSWRYSIRGGRDPKVLESGRATVTKYAINPKIADADFDIRFPPRTRVHDLTDGREVQYVVQPDGKKGVVIPVGKRPSYEDLNKPAPPK